MFSPVNANGISIMLSFYAFISGARVRPESKQKKKASRDHSTRWERSFWTSKTVGCEKPGKRNREEKTKYNKDRGARKRLSAKTEGYH